ncbi:MAG: alpha/beta hydrolase fold domain-containing protein [Sphingomonas sp.]|nr:alpha/beta hydrolase fold domain-containing protein [Sphingomonas sp.]
MLLAAASMLPQVSAAAPPAMQAPKAQMTAPGPGGIQIEQQGVIGNWYAPAVGQVMPAILLLGGSEGGLSSGTDRMAQALHTAGFAVLQLAYYRAPGQSDALALIPLETFDHALHWIAHQPGVDAKRIGMVGGSKGAEAALLVAARHPEVRAVVAGMPSSVAWPGINWTGIENRASWTAAGNPVPTLPYGMPGPNGVLDVYANGLKSLAAHAAARIQVERIAGKVLLVCGEKDKLWPSCPMAQQIRARQPRAQVLAYADAGHAVFGVPLAPDSPALPSLAQLGGTAAGNQAARIDGWPRVIAFLHAALVR